MRPFLHRHGISRSLVRLCAACLVIGLGGCAGGRRPPDEAPPAAQPPEAPPAAAPAPPPSLTADIPPEIAPNRPRAATRLVTHPWVPLPQREQTIETVDELVIEERPGERRYDFDNAVNIVTDARGRIYVHDSGGYRVIAYEPDGSFARQFGSLDDAPFHLGWIAWSGERLAMSTGTKVTVFAPDGEHLFDRLLVRYAFRRDLRGTVDGGLVGAFVALDQEARRWYSVEKRSLDDEDVGFTYWAVRVPERGSSNPTAQPGFAATRTGELYMTRGDEYAVQAFAADGTARWLLHVAGSRESAAAPELPEAEPAAADSTPVQAAPPALSAPVGGAPGIGLPLRVDGAGNLYVFPYVAAPDERRRVPVDVYSPSGERLFAGWIERRSWIEVGDRLLYGIEGEEGAQRVVGYRLEAPFLQTPAGRRR